MDCGFKNEIITLPSERRVLTITTNRWEGRRRRKLAFTALSVAVVVGAASAALANEQTEETGGYVIQGSMDGVNPVYHPDIFGKAGQAGQAYGYEALPKQPHRVSHARTKGR